MADIRPLADDELVRVTEIDVSEEDDVVFVQRARRIEATTEAWARPPKSAARRAAMIAYWTPMIRAADTAIGAFADDRLVGIGVLRLRLTDDTAQLAALFVDREHRREGVGAAIVTDVERLARLDGARFLYVSATPSRSAVGFYRSRGFEPVESPHPELFDLEPEDVHMLLKL